MTAPAQPADPAPAAAPTLRRSPWRAARGAVRAVRRLGVFFEASRGRVALLAATSVVAGLVEAALLALIAAVATGLSKGEDAIRADLGPVSIDAGLAATFTVGICLALVRGGLHLLLAYLPARMSADAMAQLRRRLFDAFIGAAWPAKASERDGQFQSLMNAHITSASQAITMLGNGVTAVLMFGTLLLSAFVLSLPAAVVLSVASVALFAALRPLARRLRASSKALSSENIEYSKGVQEVVLMAEETQVFGASSEYRKGIYGLVDGVRAPMLRTRFLSNAVPALYQSVALLVMVLALIAVSFLDATRIASLGAVVLVLVRSLTYGQQVQSAVTGMDERIPFMDRLAGALEHYSSHPQQDGPEPLPRVTSLGMSNVTYSYRPGEPVLHGLSFEAHVGETIGIVGPSGAGKSSVVQLLLRLRDPADGEVQVNGADVRRFRRADWQRAVAYVPQQPQLVWGTVAENIRYYRPHLDDAAIERAARRAHVHDEIMSWPRGYDTVIGQRASAVSGGQRQRLCLARALADDPRVLVLDEPTSALDVLSEERVQESIRGLGDDVMVFLVAHRLSTLSVCDRVMVLVDGRLEALGSTAALGERSDFFREVTEITRRSTVH